MFGRVMYLPGSRSRSREQTIPRVLDDHSFGGMCSEFPEGQEVTVGRGFLVRHHVAGGTGKWAAKSGPPAAPTTARTESTAEVDPPARRPPPAPPPPPIPPNPGRRPAA